ncbi:MAG TPA: hypothetical protein VK335_14735 [Bryobacteraceae bacterium]|nr:hypothetical protein [Bryobacteraceae bacterium]
MTQDPREVYSRLLEERRAEIGRREQRHRTLGYLKVAAAVAVGGALWMALVHIASILWVLLPAAVLAALSVFHEHLLRQLERRRRAERYFEGALARLDGNWAGTRETGEKYLDPAHPYAQDLDVFGKGSLFELLSTARTHIGEDTLARWLLAPANPETVRARHEAVNELRPRLDLREDLAIVAEEARTGVDPVSLAAWGEAAPLIEGRGLRTGVFVLTALGVPAGCAFVGYVVHQFGLVEMAESTVARLRDFFLVVMLVNFVSLHRVHKRVQAVVGAVDGSAHGLKLLSEVLVRLERENFHSPMLAALRASLDAEGDPPSKRIAWLNRLMELLDSRDHLVVRIAEPFTLWTTHLAFAVEHWRRHSGTAVRRWLTATGEIEALCSFASHAFEHPADPFPEFTADAPWLEAEGVAHPFLPESSVVRNDVRIGGELRLLVVSGSNMSGKSTLLRTLGINAVLAQAGAPVRARRLRMSPLAIGASIRITDSLQGGVSRFYAEILRLRQILDQTGGPLPVLFLIDEFLHGTNSHDRRIGAEALVRGLVERGAIGLITTHDLALADIAEGLGTRAANVHFEDQIENGQIHFDYALRPGVVRKSNAIELMRSVGLEI